MRMPQYRPLIAIHGAVLLFAFSGLFAKWLNLPAEVIVSGRTFFAGSFLFVCILICKPQALRIDKSHIKNFVLTGALLAFHWVSFFLAIQLSSVAFGLLAFATFPMFTAIIESFIDRRPLNKLHFLLSLLIIFGITLIFPPQTELANSILALTTGLLSALTFALLIVFNRKLVAQYPFYSIACYQNLMATLFLLPLSMFSVGTITTSEWSLLILLGVLFTACAHSLLNYALQTLRAFQASIAISLEPVYGILAAWLLLSENISAIMVLGAIIILSVSFYLVKKST